MKTKILLGINITLSIICLFVSLKIFWNIAIFVDEYNLSPDVVLGSSFWLAMDWLRLGLLAIMLILSLFMFVLDKRKKQVQ